MHSYASIRICIRTSMRSYILPIARCVCVKMTAFALIFDVIILVQRESIIRTWRVWERETRVPLSTGTVTNHARYSYCTRTRARGRR